MTAGTVKKDGSEAPSGRPTDASAAAVMRPPAQNSRFMSTSCLLFRTCLLNRCLANGNRVW